MKKTQEKADFSCFWTGLITLPLMVSQNRFTLCDATCKTDYKKEERFLSELWSNTICGSLSEIGCQREIMEFCHLKLPEVLSASQRICKFAVKNNCGSSKTRFFFSSLEWLMVAWSRGEQMYHDVEQLAFQIMVLKESKPHASLAFAKHKPTCSLLPAPLFPSPTAMQAHTPEHPRGPPDMQQRKAKLHLYRRHPSATAKAPCSSSWVHLRKPDHAEEEPSATSSFEKASPPFPGQEIQLCLSWGWAWKSDSQRAASSHATAQPAPAETSAMNGLPTGSRSLWCALPRCNPSGALAQFHLTLCFHWDMGRHSCAISPERKNDKTSKTAQQASDTELCAGLGLIYGAAV